MNKPIAYRIMISMMLVVLFFVPVKAQDYSALEGVAIDENGEVMKGVTVEIFSEGIKRGTTITNVDGEYIFKPLLKGTYEIRGSYPEYENVEMKEMIVGTYTLTMNMNLLPKVSPKGTPCGKATPLILPVPAEEVVISGRLKDAFNRPAKEVQVAWVRYDTVYYPRFKVDTVIRRTVTSEKGCYKFNDLKPGIYTVMTSFNGVKKQTKTIVIKKKEYVDEIVANFYFNKRTFDRFGELVNNETVVANNDSKKPLIRK